MIVTMDDRGRVTILEIALEGPVVGEPERDERVGRVTASSGTTYPPSCRASDPDQRFAGYRAKIGQPDRSPGLRSDVDE